MKRTFRTLSAAFLAALFALASCDKSDIAGNDIQQPTGSSRVIAVSFQNNSTKTELDGLQPKFVATDVIKVSNGTATQECTVSIDGSGNASITTELTGALTMVYPAAAWSNTAPYFKVSTEQDGTFASANICKATINEGETSATFTNQTAVFCITPGAGVNTNYVEVITAGPVIANSVPEGSEYDTMHKIHVASTSAEAVYVSILVPKGLKFRDLSFADGSNMKTLMDNTAAIAANTLYTVTNANWSRPYVDMQMTVDGKTRTYKWATMNVGATEVTGVKSFGDYFMWGAVEKAYTSIEFEVAERRVAFTLDTMPASYNGKNTTWDASKGYDWENAIYTNGVYSYSSSENVFTKYTGSMDKYAYSGKADGKTVLDLEDDAANANWGGSWRMPTSEDFNSLWTACTGDSEIFVAVVTNLPSEPITEGGLYYSADYYGVAGILFIDRTDPSKRVFFPAADDLYLNRTIFSTYCRYWSSSLSHGNPQSACFLNCYGGFAISSDTAGRFDGMQVRPISE